MEDKTLQALRGSIRKWESIQREETWDHGAEDCPLCHLFHPDFVDSRERYLGIVVAANSACLGCPVREHTKQPYCQDTPFRDYGRGRTTNPEKMLDFLRSLLPMGEQT